MLNKIGTLKKVGYFLKEGCMVRMEFCDSRFA
jgi:hypothetical protein